ncbi:putative alanine aminotransferase, mitochondrial [Symbiodinium microadriaticum]|uniref:Putative alanine aminotransferase, mitochondrial n=1 Tax=Symbiodinium microadriaticum TaxID=2951 RepID=A0A1Q9D2L7_SYMMI|nr:putative alanine aminotransferase, mitochondrial [Symbiodinium microadriaticum]
MWKRASKAVGARPLTFHRQVAKSTQEQRQSVVLSLMSNPALMEDAASLYPSDVLARAKEYVGKNPKFGAYSHSKGILHFRREVAKYINRRDGPSVPPADPEEIYLTDGASAGVKTVLEVMIDGPLDGLLIPIPQYPLYSASITRLGGTHIGYELVEDGSQLRRLRTAGWAIDVDLIEEKIKAFIAGGGRPKGIAVINPGNPTGNVLSRETIERIVRFAHVVVRSWGHDIVRKEEEEEEEEEECRFHSMSKGYYGECGLRGGVLQMTNIDPDVADQIYKLFSMILCANTLGQGAMASILNPPVEGDASFALFSKERSEILASLSKKAELVSQALNEIPGIQSLPVEGAMYAFPQVYLPERFVKESEATGVIVVPGSGFGQRNGTWHYRITILPEEGKLRYLGPGERAIEDKTPTPCLPLGSGHMCCGLESGEIRRIWQLRVSRYIEYLPEFKASKQHELVVFKAAQNEIVKRKQHVIYEASAAIAQAGYKIAVVLVDNLPSIAKGRSHGRFLKEGRYASDEYIESTFKNVPENYAKLKELPEVTEAYYCDNSCAEGLCPKCWLDKGTRNSGKYTHDVQWSWLTGKARRSDFTLPQGLKLYYPRLTSEAGEDARNISFAAPQIETRATPFPVQVAAMGNSCCCGREKVDDRCSKKNVAYELIDRAYEKRYGSQRPQPTTPWHSLPPLPWEKDEVIAFKLMVAVPFEDGPGKWTRRGEWTQQGNCGNYTDIARQAAPTVAVAPQLRSSLPAILGTEQRPKERQPSLPQETFPAGQRQLQVSGSEGKAVWTLGWCSQTFRANVCVQRSCISFPPPDVGAATQFTGGVSVSTYVKSAMGAAQTLEFKMDIGGAIKDCGSDIDAMATFSINRFNACLALDFTNQILHLVVGYSCFSVAKLWYFPFIGKITLTGCSKSRSLQYVYRRAQGWSHSDMYKTAHQCWEAVVRMEIRVDTAEGYAAPKDTFLSMRIGEFQKQSRFDTSKTYKFPKLEDPTGLARIEVFQRVGHLTVSLGKLQQGEQSVEVPVNMPGMPNLPMRIQLHGGEVDMEPKLKSTKVKTKYLAEHQLEEVITDVVREVIHEKPAEPLLFLSSQRPPGSPGSFRANLERIEDQREVPPPPLMEKPQHTGEPPRFPAFDCGLVSWLHGWAGGAGEALRQDWWFNE